MSYMHTRPHVDVREGMSKKGALSLERKVARSVVGFDTTMSTISP